MLLARAGIRSNEAMIRYLFARLAMPFVFGLGVVADASGPQLLPIPENLRIFAALGGAVLGFYRAGRLPEEPGQKRAHQIGAGIAGRARPAGHLRRSGAQPRRGADAGIARARD